MEAGDCRFLVTSRERLRLTGENVFPLEPLGTSGGPQAEAVRLFVERAREVRPGYSPAPEELPVLNELRRQLDAGELGAEGFQTAMRLGGNTVTELKRIVFRPAPKDDD